MNLTLLEAAKAKLEGKKVETSNDGIKWFEWAGQDFFLSWNYRIAPEPKKKVKMLCWMEQTELMGRRLYWFEEDAIKWQAKAWFRIPSEDKEVEIEND